MVLVIVEAAVAPDVEVRAQCSTESSNALCSSHCKAALTAGQLLSLPPLQAVG